MQLGTVALPLRPIGDEEPPDGPGHHLARASRISQASSPRVSPRHLGVKLAR